MTRTTDEIVLDAQRWASAPGAIKGLPADINRLLGWTSDFADDAADETPRLETFNQVLFEIYAILAYLTTRGVGEWHSTIPFETGSYAVGSDGRLYNALQDSTNIDPTTDTDDSHWIEVGRSLIPAPDGTVGSVSVQYSGGNLTVTLGRTVGTALTATLGLAIPSKASQAEIAAGTNDSKYITPRGYQSRLATESVAGIARRASASDVSGRTNDDAFVTAADTTTIVNDITGTMAQRDVFISTNPPTSRDGVAGDIWIEYET